ncbi:hypothetical protein BB8028_0006g02390 [Beauveria bassiana]|uniref:Uncharacterized protein n=1 Tax=Beauveria bassiana TaxID=176275 RepID=A0A2S7YII7_BEABA|nr:hypothetical protein BB8028_0006g02390 [Beauveria bassiana]
MVMSGPRRILGKRLALNRKQGETAGEEKRETDWQRARRDERGHDQQHRGMVFMVFVDVLPYLNIAGYGVAGRLVSSVSHLISSSLKAHRQKMGKTLGKWKARRSIEYMARESCIKASSTHCS